MLSSVDDVALFHAEYHCEGLKVHLVAAYTSALHCHEAVSCLVYSFNVTHHVSYVSMMFIMYHVRDDLSSKKLKKVYYFD